MKLSRRWVTRILVTLAVIAGVAYLLWQMNAQGQAIGLHHQTFYAKVLRTEAELKNGLSGTDNLPADQAMLFVFPRADKWGIWMKDMNYPIDVVWLNEDRVVTYMVKNFQPSSYPETKRPDQPARYVIELPSGTIDRTGIVIGDPAGLPSGI